MHTECEVIYKMAMNHREFKLITQALMGILHEDDVPAARELNQKMLQQRVSFLKDQTDKAEKALQNAQKELPQTS